jgi:hypothetical protein
MLTLLLPTSAIAQRLYIAGTTVSFEPPAEFTALTAAEVGLKYPPKNAPDFVVGNARRTTSIAFELKSIPFADSQLAQELDTLVTALQNNVRGIKWIDKKFISLDGQRWIYLEMTSSAVDTDIHNIMLITPFGGKTLLFNFNSTREEFPIFEKRLRLSLQSIRLTKA